MKTVVCINDLSGRGRGSLKANITLMSALGVEPLPIPTAILSAHTGYSHYSFCDFTSHWGGYMDTIEKLNTSIDCIYSGFLGSIAQITMIEKFIEANKPKYVVVDPVMGDNNKIYSSYTIELCDEVRKLVRKADIITPNLTEACILTNSIYVQDGSFEEYQEIAKKLTLLGPKVVIVTGIVMADKVCNLLYDNEEFHFIKSDYVDAYYGGTGDIFASIFISLYIQGIKAKKAIKIACEYLSKSIAYSHHCNVLSNDGIIIHKYLVELLEEAKDAYKD